MGYIVLAVMAFVSFFFYKCKAAGYANQNLVIVLIDTAIEHLYSRTKAPL